MTPRSMIAVFYVVAAAVVSLTNGPGAGALAGEIAMFAVFEVHQPVAEPESARVHWELDDLPAYLTEDDADHARAADLAPGPLVQ